MKAVKNKHIIYFDEIYKSYNNDENINFIQSFNEYLKVGTDKFKHEIVFFDTKKDKIYNALTIYKFVEGYYLSKYVLKFIDDDHYHNLLNGYVYILYYQILNLKKGVLAGGVLGTDLSLIYMFSLTYFTEEADSIEKQFIKFLEYHKKEEEKYNYYEGEVKEMFGYSDIVWLSSVVSKYYGKESSSKEISNYCNETINPIYKKAVDNLFSEKQSVVNEWVNELVEFHIKNSKSDLTLPFNHEEWQYYPIEIISLLEIRLKEGLKIDFIENEFIKSFLPHLGSVLPIKLDDFTLKLRNRVLSGNDTE